MVSIDRIENDESVKVKLKLRNLLPLKVDNEFKSLLSIFLDSSDHGFVDGGDEGEIHFTHVLIPKVTCCYKQQNGRFHLYNKSKISKFII